MSLASSISAIYLIILYSCPFYLNVHKKKSINMFA